MFILFTPYTYIYCSIYFMLLFSLLSLNNFFLFWLVIEILALLLIGISYTLFTSSVSHLIIYFLTQSVSSFIIFLGFIFDYSFFISLSVFLNIGIFPFHVWFFSSVQLFPNFVFFLVTTFHKIPIVVILQNFTLNLDNSLLWFVSILTTFIAGFIIISVVDLRSLLTASSIGNNSWLILSHNVSFIAFIVFFIFYSVLLFTLLTLSLSMVQTYNLTSFFMLTFITLSGLPPFPFFFLNMLLIYFFFYTGLSSMLLLLFLLSSSLIIVGYLKFLITSLVFKYLSPSSLF